MYLTGSLLTNHTQTLFGVPAHKLPRVTLSFPCAGLQEAQAERGSNRVLAHQAQINTVCSTCPQAPQCTTSLSLQQGWMLTRRRKRNVAPTGAVEVSMPHAESAFSTKSWPGHPVL